MQAKLKQKKIRTGFRSGYPVLGFRLCLDQGRALLLQSKAREILAHACRISSQPVLSFTQMSQLLRSLVWASGLIPLGSLHLRPLQRHFNVLGLTVYFITLIRPTSPCQPTWTLAVMSIHFFSLVVSLSDLSRRSS